MCGFCSRHRRSSLLILIPVCQHSRFASTRGQELGIRIVRCIHRPWFTNTSMCHGMTMLLVGGHMKIWRGWLLCSSEGSRPYCFRNMCGIIYLFIYLYLKRTAHLAINASLPCVPLKHISIYTQVKHMIKHRKC